MAKPHLTRPAYLSVVTPPPLWIVVAHAVGARIFERARGGEELKLIAEFDHPEGRLKNEELTSDRPGRVFSMSGVQKHPLDPEEEAKKHLLRKFLKSVARVLEDGRNHNLYSELALVAEPAVLGILRHEMDAQTRGRVRFTVHKDLGSLGEHEIEKSLEPELANRS